ncbi:MAG TPA: phosphoribosyl-ATP diphosphatase [Candidatus Aphodovivens avistercoris]|nr:phosphoribosyl-ATP diphosphatase [Candidatus Aphodovivens avistercoris]
MHSKTYIPEGEAAPTSQIGATLEALAATIAARRDAGEESYTHRLLAGPLDAPLKKVAEEAVEVGLAAKDVEARSASAIAAALALAGDGEAERLDVALPPEYDAAIDHLRYEAADVVYHLLVVLERFGVSLDEFAAELNNRMTEEERPVGAVRLHEEHVKRGK